MFNFYSHFLTPLSPRIGYAFLLVLIFSLGGCGGGGGGEVEPDSTTTVGDLIKTIDLTSDKLIQYEPGDYLEYDYTYSSAYDDGSGSVVLDGTLIASISASAYGSSVITKPITLTKSVWDGSDALINTITSYDGYDSTGSYREYLLGDLSYVNQSDPDSGALYVPGQLSVGLSWSNNKLLIFVGELYEVLY